MLNSLKDTEIKSAFKRILNESGDFHYTERDLERQLARTNSTSDTLDCSAGDLSWANLILRTLVQIFANKAQAWSKNGLNLAEADPKEQRAWIWREVEEFPSLATSCEDSTITNGYSILSYLNENLTAIWTRVTKKVSFNCGDDANDSGDSQASSDTTKETKARVRSKKNIYTGYTFVPQTSTDGANAPSDNSSEMDMDYAFGPSGGHAQDNTLKTLAHIYNVEKEQYWTQKLEGFPEWKNAFHLELKLTALENGNEITTRHQKSMIAKGSSAHYDLKRLMAGLSTVMKDHKIQKDKKPRRKFYKNKKQRSN